MLHDVASARVVDSLHSISNIQKATYVGAFFVSVGCLVALVASVLGAGVERGKPQHGV